MYVNTWFILSKLLKELANVFNVLLSCLRIYQLVINILDNTSVNFLCKNIKKVSLTDRRCVG